MKKIGIVGGVAWQSTVEYYTGICRMCSEWRRANGEHAAPLTPEMSIESLDLNRAFALLGRDGEEASWHGFDEYHRAALQRLEASGADFAAIASNTPHHRFETIVRGVKIPVLSILDAAAAEAVRMGAKLVLILGTAVTMESATFRAAFSHHGIEAAGPTDPTVRRLTVDLISDLHRNIIDGAAERLITIARSATAGAFSQPTVVCLACTELPLAFPDCTGLPSFERHGIRFINTAAAHIQAVFDYAAS